MRYLFTHLGDGPALTEADVVGPAIAAVEIFHASSLNPSMGMTIRRVAELALAPGECTARPLPATGCRALRLGRLQ